METTRHFVATVYAINDGAVALHHHDKLDMWLPPGGHVDRDELPHEAAKRETREELGLDPTLVTPENVGLESETATAMPRPQHFLLEDINVCDGEAPADAWEWYAPADIEAEAAQFTADVREAAKRAIRLVAAEAD